jgi:spermidine synthase
MNAGGVVWMNTSPSVSHRLALILAIACSSAAALIFEIALTRIFAVTQFYHFAFMAVSLALLGYGASGSILAVFPALAQPRRWVIFACAQSLATLGAYLLANALPFDSYSIAWDGRQVVYLALSYFALIAPFFCAGLVMGAVLSRSVIASPAGAKQSPASTAETAASAFGLFAVTIPSHHAYAANLLGSGAGCLLALIGMSWWGGVGAIVFAALVAMLSALGFQLASDRRSIGFTAITLGAIVLFTFWVFQPPDRFELRLSPYKDLSAALRYPGAQIVSTHWNASSRVDHVQSEGIRSLPGLSFTYRGNPPQQDALTFDGDDLTPLPLIERSQASYAPYLLMSLPFLLRPDRDVLILEPRGGLDVFLARLNAARSITAVEPNELAVAAASAVYDDPRTRVIVDEPRAYVERTADQFDVIDLALTAPYRPVTSGAYSLAEDYRFTVEAFERYLSHLKPAGLFASLRWLQSPPSEETRLIALAAEAVRRSGADPTRSIVALRGYNAVLLLVKNGVFSRNELRFIRDIADRRQFDLITAPDLQPGESNQYNVLPVDNYVLLARQVLTDPASVYASYAFDLTPPTDDHPFFTHFFKWSQASEVFATLGLTWQPFGGAGYFVLIVLLIFSMVTAVVVIVLPLVAIRSRVTSLRGAPFATKQSPPAERGIASHTALAMTGSRRWTLAYFGLLGLGFLCVEIPLIQTFILLVGRPTIAFAVVLFALLIASGLGSLASRRVPWLRGAIVLTILIALYPTLIRALTNMILLAPIEARVIVGALALFPLGFLMGTMFPKGIAYLEDRSPALIPWAWGINGAMSVISAIGSALLALTFGFTFVVACGAVCYGVCALLVVRLRRRA